MANYNVNVFNVPRLSEGRISQHQDQPGSQLPLNLLGLIISHLDNVADLARCCQASRVLYYMCLPQLYRHITLSSYDTIRYKNERPEGCGSASPFCMGLNALVTRNVVNLVRSLSLQGVWREHDLYEYSQVGRVPDDAMMLNIAVRAAIDRCIYLESFKWDLSTKLLPSVYSGLAGLQNLRTLYVRFPSSRAPRPMIMIPPMPQLRSLTFTHIDPLCYSDDVSNVIYSAKNLDTLQMHWSPRMRDEGDPSVQVDSYFRKNLLAKKKLALKKVGFYNLFAFATPEMPNVFDYTVTETLTMLNSMGSDETRGEPPGSISSFVDGTWYKPPRNLINIKSFRHDRLNRESLRFMEGMQGLQKIYLVNARHSPPSQNGYSSTMNPSPASLNSSINTPSDSSSRPSITSSISTPIRDAFLDMIVANHGSTLKHLLLPSFWALAPPTVARLFRACPNLTQLGIAIDFESAETTFKGIRMLFPFLKKIRAIRILIPLSQKEASNHTFESIVNADDDIHAQKFGLELAGYEDFPNLKWVGLGWKAWEIGCNEEVIQTVKDKETGEQKEEAVLRRRTRRVDSDAVKDVEIWKMDTLDIF